MLGGAALLLLPFDVLPAAVVVTTRMSAAVVGPLHPADVIALAYLVRLFLGRRFLELRVTPARTALFLFLAWTALVTLTGVGVLSALCRVVLYAAVGIAVAARPRSQRWAHAGVVGLAIAEVVLYLPQAPSRLSGAFVGDPAQMGALLIAALLVVCTAHRSPAARFALGAILMFGIVMTLTRSIWFAGIAVALAAVLPRRWYLPLLLPPALAAVLMPFVGLITSRLDLNPESAALRTRSVSAGLREFQSAFFTGHGWAFTTAAGRAGLTGVNEVPVYDLWIYLGLSAGLVGIALFAILCGLLARESLTHAASGRPPAGAARRAPQPMVPAPRMPEPGTREPEACSVAYLFLTATLAISLTEMPFYACSLTAVLFFLLTPVSRWYSDQPIGRAADRSTRARNVWRR